jgi:hypothetical protein
MLKLAIKELTMIFLKEDVDVYVNEDGVIVDNPFTTTNKAFADEIGDSEKFGTISNGIMDSEMIHKIEEYNQAKERAVLRSKDLVNAYNTLISCEVDKLFNMKSKDSIEYGVVYRLLQMYEDSFKPYGYSIEDFKQMIKESSLVESSNDPEFIKQTLVARQQYCNMMVKLLQEMVQSNYMILDIDHKQAKAISDAIGKSKTRALGMGDLRNIVYKNRDKFIHADRIDLRPLNGGVLLYGQRFNYRREDDISLYLQELMTYDYIILTHGGSGNKDITNAYQDYYNGKIGSIMLTLKTILKNPNKNTDWFLGNPVKVYTGQVFVDMGDLIRWCINDVREYRKKTGKKQKENIKIKIMACNPGAHKIPDQIVQDKDVIIKYSQYSNIAEAEDIEDSINDNLDRINEALDEYQNIITECEKAMYSINEIQAVDNFLWKLVVQAASALVALIVRLIRGFMVAAAYAVKKIKLMYKDIKYEVHKDLGVKEYAMDLIGFNEVINEAVNTKAYPMTFKEKEAATLKSIDNITNEMRKRTEDQKNAAEALRKFAMKHM